MQQLSKSCLTRNKTVCASVTSCPGMEHGLQSLGATRAMRETLSDRSDQYLSQCVRAHSGVKRHHQGCTAGLVVLVIYLPTL